MDSNQIWSWTVTVLGLVGFVLAGRRKWWSWYINLGCQALWVVYALTSHQRAFLVSATVYVLVFGRNAYTWTRDHFRTTATQPDGARNPKP